MFLNLYLGLSTIAFAFLFTVWSSKNWINILVKFGLLLMAVIGLVMSLNTHGFIVKI